nr:unnamed protein product [Digitaria exilis]
MTRRPNLPLLFLLSLLFRSPRSFSTPRRRHSSSPEILSRRPPPDILHGRIRPSRGWPASFGYHQQRVESDQAAAAPGRAAAASRHLRRRAPSPANRAYLDIQETPLDVCGTHTTDRSSSQRRSASPGPRCRRRSRCEASLQLQWPASCTCTNGTEVEALSMPLSTASSASSLERRERMAGTVVYACLSGTGSPGPNGAAAGVRAQVLKLSLRATIFSELSSIEANNL